MKRIVVLYQDTGGGHRSTAEAVIQGLNIAFPERYHISSLNFTPYLPWPASRGEQSYPAVVDRARFVHAALFHVLNGKRRVAMLRRWFSLVGRGKAAQLLADHPADAYVSCHPLCSQFMPPAIHRARSMAAFVHVVTDLLSGHTAHFARDIDHCCVPNPQVRRQAVANRVPPERIDVTGQPVWPDLRARMAEGGEMRAKLALDPGVPVALLLGGGDGMGALGPTARAILSSDLNLQLIVVCGRNEALRDDLSHAEWRLKLRVLGFVDVVPELMGASDILITKAGTLTLCEGFLAGLPILIYDAIPGQEAGNVDYVVSAGAGAWCPAPGAVLEQLRAWLADPAGLAAARASSGRLAQPDAAIEVAKVVARVCG